MPIPIDCDQRTWCAAQKLAAALAEADVSAENARATDAEGWDEIAAFAEVKINDEIVSLAIRLLEAREAAEGVEVLIRG
jgi:hypothetical protein